MPKTVEIPDGQESFKLNEVCKLANVQPYMLRFWGTEFEQLEAKKSSTGQRMYDRAQVELILEVRRLLFDEGLTIAGARKKVNAMREQGGSAKGAPKRTPRVAARAGKQAEPQDDEPDAAPTTKALQLVATPADDRAVEPLISSLREIRSQIVDILAELR